MDTFFLLCTIAGGTILVLQLALSLLGLGGHLIGGDVPLVGGDVPHLGDAGGLGDLGGGHVGHGVGGHDLGGHDAGQGHDASGHGHGHDGRLSSLAKRLTFQAVVAFVTFFGVGGLSAGGFGWSLPSQSMAAVATGAGATVLLGYAFGSLRTLQNSGSLRIENAVGARGRVYLRIPGGPGGPGKVTVPVQGRLEELHAVTPGPELRSGEPVVVTRVVDGETVEVVAEAAYVAKSEMLAE